MDRILSWFWSIFSNLSIRIRRNRKAKQSFSEWTEFGFCFLTKREGKSWLFSKSPSRRRDNRGTLFSNSKDNHKNVDRIYICVYECKNEEFWIYSIINNSEIICIYWKIYFCAHVYRRRIRNRHFPSFIIRNKWTIEKRRKERVFILF